MKTEYIFLQLEALTPVHIGCAEVYEPTSFYIDKSAGELVHFDLASFIDLLEKEDLRKLSTICSEATPASLIKLWRFIRQQAGSIQLDGYRVPVCNGLVGHYEKTLGISQHDSRRLRNGINQFQIMRSAFDPITGLLYIPGSAVKGAIRTAILNARKDRVKKRFKGKNAGRELQQAILGYKFKHLEADPFRLLKVSDFIPAAQVSRKIVYAVDHKKHPNKFKARAYQILEVINPGTQFVGMVSIQEPIKSKIVGHPLTRAEILDALENFYGSEKSREDRELSGIGIKSCKVSKGFPVRIGRHSGAECVTIKGHRDIKIMKGRNKDSEFKDHATTVWLAAPSSHPANLSGLKPFGWMSLNELQEKEWTDACNNIDAIRSTLFQKAVKEFQEKKKEREKIKARQAEEEQKRLEHIKYPWKARLESILKINNLHLLKKKVLNDTEMSKWLEDVDDVQQAIKNKVDALVRDIAPTISDWGILKQQLLENELVKKWAKEPSIADSVKHAASKVAQEAYKKGKWSDERDELVRNFLEDIGQIWDLVLERTGEAFEPESQNLQLMERIKTLSDWKAFRNSGIKIQELDLGCCKALMEKFKKWKSGKSKDKQERNKFKALKKRIKNLERASNRTGSKR